MYCHVNCFWVLFYFQSINFALTCSITLICCIKELLSEFAAWSGFHWNHCYFSWLHWYSITCMWSCGFGTYKGKSSRMMFGRYGPLLMNNRLYQLLMCMQVAEILKDRPSWFRDCRAVDILNAMSTGNGGTIELLYMQVKIFHMLNSVVVIHC